MSRVVCLQLCTYTTPIISSVVWIAPCLVRPVYYISPDLVHVFSCQIWAAHSDWIDPTHDMALSVCVSALSLSNHYRTRQLAANKITRSPSVLAFCTCQLTCKIGLHTRLCIDRELYGTIRFRATADNQWVSLVRIKCNTDSKLISSHTVSPPSTMPCFINQFLHCLKLHPVRSINYVISFDVTEQMMASYW